MGKSKKTAARKAKQAAARAEPTRRDTLKLMRNGAVGVAVLGAAGFVGARSVRATMSEFDLGRVGNGVPSIVQVHDPTCPLCTQLQRETRQALKSLEAGRVQYLVADIKTDDGAAFAARYGAPHVTLLLFDGDGQLQQTLNGVRPDSELSAAFVSHLARHGG